MKKFLSLLILLIITTPLVVSAYYESVGPGDLRSDVYPLNPGVNQKTNLSLSSYLINLNTCKITWKQDDEQIAEGIGQKSLSFTTGPLGKSLKVSAILNCPGKEPITKDWLFQSNDVDFLISADTYTPPFYKGGSVMTPKSKVKIVAMPQVFTTAGEPIKPESLIYKWTKDGKTMSEASGYGKNILNFLTDELSESTTFSLEISSLSGEIKAVKSIKINTDKPQVIIYQNKPLIGIQYQKSEGGLLNLTENETTLTAEPFFFSNSDISQGNLGFSWFMNNKLINQNANENSITIRKNLGQTGETVINLQINNSNNVFSKAQNTLRIKWGEKTSFFGF